MKKLLMKWFPKYFIVNKYLKFEDLERSKALDLAIVDPDHERVFAALGISEKRAEELNSLAHQTFYGTNNITMAMKVLSEKCTHINEYSFALMMILEIRFRVSGGGQPVIHIIGR